MRLVPLSTSAERREYYTRNLVFFGFLLGFIPACLIFGQLANLIGVPGIVAPLSLTWFVALFASSAWRMNYTCPRCGEKFYYKLWYRQANSTKCVHCGFRPGRRSN